jgi:hypothetical protein
MRRCGGSTRVHVRVELRLAGSLKRHQDGSRWAFLHPDLKQVEVAGVPIKNMVDGIREFISKRGYALGRLDAVENGVFEDWGMTEHPGGGSCFSIGRTST